MVVISGCRSCRAISAWGPQTIYLFEGGVRGIIGGNRGCRGKRGKKGGKIGCKRIQVHPFAYKRITLIVAAISAQTPLDRDGSYSNPDLAVFT